MKNNTGKKAIIDTIQEDYSQQEIIEIITELINNLNVNNNENNYERNDRTRRSNLIRRENERANKIEVNLEPTNRGDIFTDHHLEEDRSHRPIRIGNRVQALTPVRGRYPTGKVIGFVRRLLQGRLQVYVRFESEDSTIHHHLGRNLNRED